MMTSNDRLRESTSGEMRFTSPVVVKPGQRINGDNDGTADLDFAEIVRPDRRAELEYRVVDQRVERRPRIHNRSGVGVTLGHPATDGRGYLRASKLTLGDRQLRPCLRVRGVGKLHRNLRGQVIFVGDAAGLQERVGAILLGLSVRAIGLGQVEVRPRAIAGQAKVGGVEYREHLTAKHAIAFVPHDALDARRHLGNHDHLGARVESPGQRQCLGQASCLDGRRANRNRAVRLDGRRLGFGAAAGRGAQWKGRQRGNQ